MRSLLQNEKGILKKVKKKIKLETGILQKITYYVYKN